MTCLRAAICVAAVLTCAASLDARVTRLVIENRESPAFQGKVWGTAGQYELLTGYFLGELDPADAHNATINDIRLAVRNSRGLVEYKSTFAIARPVDSSKSSGLMIYGVPNRGGGAPMAGPEGNISVVSGWQGDLAPSAGRQTIEVPIAKNTDGSSITGPVTAIFTDARPGSRTLALRSAVSAISYQLPVSLDTAKASLTKRGSVNGSRTAIAGTDWAFADCTDLPFPGMPSRTSICAKDGFDPALLYELVYVSKDPLVLGVGYGATRDLISFLRYAEEKENPVAGQVRFAVGAGNSQSGNFLRSFVHLGFNQDEQNRIVWDGINPHIAARQLAMNFRFAVAGGTSRLYEPGSDGIVWWSSYPDAARKRPKGGLLDRCLATKTCPKIIETFGGLEFWALRMSPDLVGTDAKADIPLLDNVRRYYLPATSHGGGRGGFQAAAPPIPAGCVLPANPNSQAESMKALRTALVEWVMKGVEPPPSRYPKLRPASEVEGRLVAPTAEAMGFPAIPGVPKPDGVINPVLDYDFGPEFRYADLSGAITQAPPIIRGSLPTLVPNTDADGNDVGGVRSVLLQVPLGTYTGWNPQAGGFDRGKQCGLTGGYIPFVRTKAERVAAGDPRPSLEERYGSHEKYVELVRAAAAKAVAERYLLPADADALVAQAAGSDVLKAH